MLNRPTRAVWVSRWLDPSASLFALFLSAGYLKSDPRFDWIPVDLTMLCGLLVLIQVLHEALTQKWQKSILWVYGLTLVLLPSALWTDWHVYAIEKILRYCSLTVIAMMAPLFLFRESPKVGRIFNSLSIVGTAMAVDALLSLPSLSGEWMRLTAFGSGPLNLGRATGAAVIWVMVMWLEGRIATTVAIPVATILSFTLFASGSRGPLISVALALVIYVVRTQGQRTVSWLKIGVVSLIFMSVLVVGSTWAPAAATSRVQSLLSGQLEDRSRLEAYAASWEYIASTPLGIGWGGFASKINFWPGQIRQYPHNLLIEIALEQGWIASGFVLVLLVSGVWAAWRKVGTTDDRAILPMLTFFILNAMVTGDMNDNRSMFALVAIALTAAPTSPKQLPARKDVTG